MFSSGSKKQTWAVGKLDSGNTQSVSTETPSKETCRSAPISSKANTEQHAPIVELSCDSEAAATNPPNFTIDKDVKSQHETDDSSSETTAMNPTALTNDENIECRDETNNPLCVMEVEPLETENTCMIPQRELVIKQSIKVSVGGSRTVPELVCQYENSIKGNSDVVFL